MIIVMKQGANDEQIHEVISLVEKLGYKSHLSKGVERTIIGVIGSKEKSSLQSFASLDRNKTIYLINGGLRRFISQSLLIEYLLYNHNCCRYSFFGWKIILIMVLKESLLCWLLNTFFWIPVLWKKCGMARDLNNSWHILSLYFIFIVTEGD